MVRLAILGLLSRRPMHGYEIQRYLEMTRSDQWAGILPGSIYHALKKMHGEGLIEVTAMEHTGNRSRAVYGITENGRAEFKKELREAWRTASPLFPSRIYMAVHVLDDLPRAEVLAAIAEHVGALRKQLDIWNEGEQLKVQYSPFPGLMQSMFRNGREHLEADIRFLTYLMETLPALPTFDWQVPPMKEEE